MAVEGAEVGHVHSASNFIRDLEAQIFLSGPITIAFESRQNTMTSPLDPESDKALSVPAP